MDSMQASSRYQTTSSISISVWTGMGNISSVPNNRCLCISHTRTSNNNKIKVHSLIRTTSPPLVLNDGQFKKGENGGTSPKQSTALNTAAGRIEGTGLPCPNPLHGQRIHRIIVALNATAPRDMTRTLRAVGQHLQCALRSQESRQGLPPRR